MSNTKVTAWIIENEPLGIEILGNYIISYGKIVLTKIISDTKCLQHTLSEHTFADIVFIDLNLNGAKVIDFIPIVQKHSRFIIITTAYIPAHIQSMLNIDYSNILFLHKPFSYATFFSTIKEARKKMEY